MIIIIFFNNLAPEVNKRRICFLHSGVEKVSSYYTCQVLDYVSRNLDHSGSCAGHNASDCEVSACHDYSSHCKNNDSGEYHREIVFLLKQYLEYKAYCKALKTVDDEGERCPLGESAEDIGNSSTKTACYECCYRTKGEGCEVDCQVAQVYIAAGGGYRDAHCNGHDYSDSCQDCC